ncbi:MAG TPA: LysR substrate-binding domain-containing protein [Burkholderiaceae bacterium]|nr:LysR substrate-binding domain-containing protein [Burkholderiaceae bacterium]
MPSLTQKEFRLPPLAAIQAFESAARLGSFEKASEELSITASAVGKRVATLEELIGVSLFTRGARGLQLSAAGKEYLEQVRVALGLLSQVSLHARCAQRAERLRVVAPPTFSRQILVPHLVDFTSSHRHVEPELLLSVPYLDIGPADADLEIHFGSGVYAGLVCEKLLDEPVFPVCAPAYLRSVKGLRSPRDLSAATLLRSPLEPWRPWFEAAGLDWPEPAMGSRFVDLGMLLEAAVNAQGVALARRSLAHAWLDSGTLVRLFDIEACPQSDYYLCHAAARPLTGARADFAAWLKGVCARITRPE